MSAKARKIMRVVLKAQDRETLARLVSEFHLDVGGGGPRRLPDGGIRMEAYVTEDQLEKLTASGAVAEVLEDATQVGKERQKEVGKGDRFEGGRKVPHGLGKKE